MVHSNMVTQVCVCAGSPAEIGQMLHWFLYLRAIPDAF